MTDPHTCPGYECERPECVRRQRDELRAIAIPPRDPTEKMLEAGGRSIIIGQETRPGSSWAEEAALAWRAMYDAALAEKEGK